MVHDTIHSTPTQQPHCHCDICGAVFKLGEQHTCGNANMPAQRILVGGYWYVLDEGQWKYMVSRWRRTGVR